MIKWAFYLFNGDVSCIGLGICDDFQSPLGISLYNLVEDFRAPSKGFVRIRGFDDQDGGANGRVFRESHVSILRKKWGGERKQCPLSLSLTAKLRRLWVQTEVTADTNTQHRFPLMNMLQLV